MITKTGLLPTKISALGIDFGSPDKISMLHFVSLVISYYLLAFIVYAASDFITWRVSFINEYRKLKLSVINGETDHDDNRIIFLQNRWNLLSTPTSIIRAIFEFIVPIILSLYSIITLLIFKI